MKNIDRKSYVCNNINVMNVISRFCRSPDRFFPTSLYIYLVIPSALTAFHLLKNGDKSAVADSSVREHLIEEMADVLMYYNDVMLCYGITEDELKQAYIEKFQKNMKRW